MERISEIVFLVHQPEENDTHAFAFQLEPTIIKSSQRLKHSEEFFLVSAS